MLNYFLTSNDTSMRLARTIVSGLVSVLIVAVPFAIAGLIHDTTWASIATAAIMCVLSPFMSMLRTGSPEEGVVEADRGGME